MNGMYYLNNTGSHWVVYDNGKKPKVTFETKSGATVTRTALWFEQFGNFCVIAIKYKGKIIKVFGDSVLED